jgi:hypothetical protein
MPKFTEKEVDLATERLESWGNTLTMLAKGENPAKLLDALQSSGFTSLQQLLE